MTPVCRQPRLPRLCASALKTLPRPPRLRASALKLKPFTIHHSPLTSSRAAFTLMELLVVMSIMLVISSILVAGYFGMTRAASYTAAETDVFNHLQLARQRASLDGARVFFMLLDSNSYVLVHGVGQLTSDMDNKTTGKGFHSFYDAYADLHEITNDASRVRVWNMDKNVYGNDVNISMAEEGPIAAYPGGETYFRNTCLFHVKLPSAGQFRKWKQGDRYGFELYPRQVLPKGFYFDLVGAQENVSIVFKPDGTSGLVGKDGAIIDQNTDISIFEKITKGKNEIKITVQADGSIVVAEL
jgi:prepilin-type N-terminal cleavage/methylation domain-containing protein